MPFNGSGSFSLIFNWQQDALNNINISSSRMMGQENDIAAGLSLCLTKDGQQTPTANIPMGGFRLTNMGNATAQGNAVSVQDAQNSSVTTLTSVSGTDTITANTAPSIGSYASGQRFQFMPAGANTTTGVTLNINGLGAKNVLKPTMAGLIALAAGDIVSTVEQTVFYDGTRFQLQALSLPSSGSLINVQTFASSGTYTPTPGTNSVIVEVQAGGGGGGTCNAPGAGSASGGGAGGGGGFARARITSGFSGVAVTVGAAGTGGSAAPSAGGNGGNSSFGSLVVCSGGNGGGAGGSTGSAGTAPGAASSGNATTSGAGTSLLFQRVGSAGDPVIVGTAGGSVNSGTGGDSFIGAGAQGQTTGAGRSPATGSGAGGSGAAAAGATGPFSGGSGGAGFITVYEYA